MRFVVFGAGAIGGVAGARLHQAGHEVVLIARGAHYEAIRDNGLTLEAPDEHIVLEIDACDSPAEITWSGSDVVLLATKSQDTAGALAAMRAVAPPATAIVCMQNGVENERLALRLFANVYGAVVMMPAAHIEPGVVESHASQLTGIIDVGRYPGGADELAEEIAAALRGSRFEACAHPDVMRLKHAKLLLNLANAVGALCEAGPEADQLTEAVREEGQAVLSAAGIEFDAPEVADVAGRWKRLGVQPGRRSGSSTWQSLARHAGEVETDFLNGEILLLGRLHGVPTPVNEALAALAYRAARDGAEPRSLKAQDVLAHAGGGAVAWTR
ncbi:MAG TPA: 2-dehydropantoate 2-reductase [Solirubrobacteraceae bacterium]|jgi:2-dehydropantoate 2-reductase